MIQGVSAPEPTERGINGGVIVTGLDSTPAVDWADLSSSPHLVQFYESEAFLLASLGAYVAAGLGAGEACVVVARPGVREGLVARLEHQGFDMAAAAASDRYVALDAAETLGQLWSGEALDAERFEIVIGGTLARAARQGRGLRVFGEMVALLWTDGHREAALEMERLWNGLQTRRSFVLYCAYPIQVFGGEEHVGPLDAVCAAHSRVIPAESYSALRTADERLREIVLLQQKARSLEAEVAERRTVERALRTVTGELEIQVDDLRRARAEAEAANRMKDEFLATVSHELRTPLNAIIGWAHMLRSAKLDEATRVRAVETIERNARAQAQLIEDILDVSRMVRGQLRLNFGPVDLAAVITTAIDSVQPVVESKALRLEVTLDASARHVWGDTARLQQVVWNLLSNAIKFTPDAGGIAIRLGRENGRVQLAVADSGQGISPDVLPFIFDRFRQADGSTTRRHAGLGLGLSIVQFLVEHHGGTVRAESAGEGQGSTFTIELPLPADRALGRLMLAGSAASMDVPAASALGPLPSLEGLRVLVVDDDLDTCQMLGVALSERKATVETVASVSEALEALARFRPDAIVSDLAMPEQDGYAFIRELRVRDAAAGGRTPAIALTAYTRIEDRARALAAGYSMFVGKPVEPRELVRVIASLVEPSGRV